MYIYIYIYTRMENFNFFLYLGSNSFRSQRSRRLRSVSVVASMLGLRIQIPPGARMSVVSVVCCQVEVPAMG